MLTPGVLQAALLSSEEAHRLGSFVEDLARQWIANTQACDDVNGVFDTLRVILARAISNVASDWNSRHDGLRALPPEIQEQCFASLPVPDRSRLSQVCTHWCTNIANSPGIWPQLRLNKWKPGVNALLARSGRLPLDVSVDARGGLMPWDASLRLHAARLRKLELREVSRDITGAFSFLAPHLEGLSIVGDVESSLNLSPDIFNRDTPRLRTVRLTGLALPLECPAFASVTALTLNRPRGPFEHLFALTPRLETLNIGGRRSKVSLPALPRPSFLRVLRLVNVFVTVDQLVRLGYTELDVLDVSTSTVNTIHFLDALARWPDLATTIRMWADWNFETVVRPDGRRLRFAVRPYFHGVFQKLVQQRSTAFSHIVRLVLPVSFKERSHTPPCPPLVEENRGIPLPALHTLVLECSNIRPADDTYPLRECVCGTFKVPRLARIEVLKAPGAAWDAPLERVDVANLVWLVETVLRCDDRGALEVFVDTASGVSLDGDLELLRNCVGKVVIRCLAVAQRLHRHVAPKF